MLAVRRMAGLGAVALSATLLAGTPAAHAACVTRGCTSASGDQTSRRDPGDGVVCLYVKLDEPAPDGWEKGGSAPYIWIESQSWGSSRPNQWDYRFCSL
jgi:hypothetical protein